MIPVFKPNIGKKEVQAVSKVLLSGWLGNGAKTKEFEEKFATFVGAKYSLAVNSASAALHLALLVSGVKKGDEVITPSLTFVATNHPILMLSAIPVFCDVDKDSLCADVEDIKRKITKKTKAIIVVHYGGNVVSLESLINICKKRHITLIEDCAHAMGSYYKGKHVGTFGDIGCFSFAAIKNLTSGDGGMIIGKNKDLLEKARVLAWSGISSSTWERFHGKKFKWQYNVLSVGWKYQMNDISAAIGVEQLRKLLKNNKKRKEVTDYYNKNLANIPWIKRPIPQKGVESSHHNYVIKVPKYLRDKLSDYLARKKISTTVHYMPSHLYDLYKKFKIKLPITEKVWQEILLLPIFPTLSKKEQDYIIREIKKFKT